MDESEQKKLEIQVRQKVLERTAEIVHVALDALSIRLITVLALVLQAGIFCWAMAAPTWERVAGATLFAIASWCLVHHKGRST